MVKNSEDLVQKFSSLPTYGSVTDGEYDKQLRHMVNYMTQLSPSTLVAGTSGGDDFLDVSNETMCNSYSDLSIG